MRCRIRDVGSRSDKSFLLPVLHQLRAVAKPWARNSTLSEEPQSVIREREIMPGSLGGENCLKLGGQFDHETHRLSSLTTSGNTPFFAAPLGPRKPNCVGRAAATLT
jgi:hypothetical protein